MNWIFIKISLLFNLFLLSQHLYAIDIHVNSLDDFSGKYPNSTFLINSPINLEGTIVQVPDGSTISIADGYIYNGTIVGCNTKLDLEKNASIGIHLRGSWNVVDITDLWFDDAYLDDDEIMLNINHLQSDDIYNKIHLYRNYFVSIDSLSYKAFVLSSNTSLHIDSTIKIKPNNYAKYGIIDITNRKNVSVEGGQIIGDVGQHKYIANSTSEWGMGINIVASSNVSINNTIISLCTGDGIYLGGFRENNISCFDNACRNITIDNVICDMNRRQGISIVHAKDVYIIKSVFSNTGQVEFINPGHGIDIEPNFSKNRNMSVYDIRLNGCKFYNNMSSDLSTAHYFLVDSVPNIKNIIINNSEFSGGVTIRSGSFYIDRSVLNKIRVDVSSRNLYDIEVQNSTIIGGLYLHSSVSDKNHPEYTGILNSIVFKKCDFTNEAENKGKSILCLSGDMSRVKNLIFDDCKFDDNGGVNRKLLNRERNGAYIFINCSFTSGGSR